MSKKYIDVALDSYIVQGNDSSISICTHVGSPQLSSNLLGHLQFICATQIGKMDQIYLLETSGSSPQSNSMPLPRILMESCMTGSFRATIPDSFDETQHLRSSVPLWIDVH